MRFTSLLLVLLCSAQVRGQEAYPIRLKEADRGDIRRSDVSSSTEITNKLVGTSGNVLQEKTVANAQQSVYREMVLAKTAGQQLPSRLRREYEKATVWIENKPQVLPHQGKTVLIENKDGKCSFRLENGEAMTGLAADLLDREMKKGDLRGLMLPKRAVRLNDPWKIAMAPVLRVWERAVGLQLDSARASGTGRLTRVYRKDGRLFGAMSFRLETPIAAVGEKKFQADAGSKLVMNVSLDCCIDGGVSSGTLQASFQVRAGAAVPTPDGQQAHLLISTRGALREIRTELPRR